MRYFMRLAYRGANYHGWQVQPNGITVQEAVERALRIVMGHDTPVTGAGRTDTGVNAAMMVAHFDVEHEITDTGTLSRSLNGLLGRDVAIYSVFPVASDAHARFDATKRTYKYFTHSVKSPFLYPLSWQYHGTLDFDKMNRAASRLPGYTDFTSFSKLHTDVATNNCKVSEAYWEPQGEQMVFTICADRFLRNMVRAVVGTLVDVGRGKISEDDFCRIIERKDRCAAGASMPGNALFLWRIEYPFEIM